MSYEVKLSEIEQARQRISPYVRHTPLLPLPLLHHDAPQRLRLKLENLQLSGSFKVRGAFNTLLQLDSEQAARGVIASSGGNHGLALAYAAQRLGIPAIVYLPANATADREARIAARGARVMRHGNSWDDAHARALEHAAAEGLYYVHPFDSPLTVAGQGTLGLELLDDLPALDCVVIAIGGGGLISGIAAAIKQQRPDVRIIGVEPVGAPSMLRSVESGHVVRLPSVRTIADTLLPMAVSERTLTLTQHYVDEIVLVEDSQMIAGMRWLWTECNQLVEPAGAAAVAAILNGQADISRAAHPIALICGGNAAAASVFTIYEQQVAYVPL